LQESLSHSDTVTGLVNGVTPETTAQLLSNLVAGNGSMPSAITQPSLSGLDVNGK
jgi:hypothetical protein